MLSTCKHRGQTSVECCVRCYTHMCPKCTDASFEASLCEECMSSDEVSRDPDEWLQNWVETVAEMERMRRDSTDATDFLLRMFHSAGFEAERMDIGDGFVVPDEVPDEYDSGSVLTLRVLDDDQTVVCKPYNACAAKSPIGHKQPRAKRVKSSRKGYVPSSRTNTEIRAV